MSYGHSTYNYCWVCRVTIVNPRINITKKSGTVPSHKEKLCMQKTKAEFRHPSVFEIHLLCGTDTFLVLVFILALSSHTQIIMSVVIPEKSVF